VLAIMATASAAALPLAQAGRQRLELRAAALDLAARLRVERAVAMRENVERSMTLDVAARRYSVAGAAPYGLPPGIRISVEDLVSEQLETASARIRFHPDGSASGGRIRLSDGRRTIAVEVDWLTGHASIEDRP
jgi:general secretion pathway protein H